MRLVEILTKKLKIESPAFKHKDEMPAKYTCSNGVSPGLLIANIPENTKRLAIIVDDPDAPGGMFSHWVVWNITPKDKIDENSSPGKTGVNSIGKRGYHPPCPPNGTHHYYFRVYALDTELQLPDKTDRAGLLRAMEKHIVAKGELVGIVKKQIDR